MERSEVSLHEVKLYRVFQKTSPDKWLTNKEAASSASVNERTARMHTRRFVALGLLDLAEVFPAHRFRWSKKANRRNVNYLQRLEQADAVFGEA